MNIGKAYIEPCAAVEAGSFQEIVYTFEAGHPIDDTGYIKIVFRFAGDFGTPQFDKPQEADFCSVSTNADCRIGPRWDPKGHTRPWGKALYLKIMAGFVNTGDKIKVVFGDRSKGSPGWRMQTFCEDSFEFKTLADPFATYQFKELPESPAVKIIPGKVSKAVCVAPSQVKKGAAFTTYLRLEDRWGNAVSEAKASKHAALKNCGVLRIECQDEKSGLKAISNPIKVIGENQELSNWWADFHGQSEETIGSNSIEDYFAYARNCAVLDIVAHQGNDFQVTDEFWEKINRTAEKYYDPGRLVTFPGYEWSGNTPLGGDRNIYYNKEGNAIYRSCNDLLPEEYSKYPLAPTAADLFKRLPSSETFAFAHVGGRYADVSMHTDDIETAMEIHSAWGTFEWLVYDALKRGHRIGICANSDGHKCRPGASYPGANKFGSYGGLTCVLAEKLDRDSVFAAMKARHFYATTGNRPLVDIEVITTNGIAVMGDVIKADSAELKVKLNATAPIDYVEIHNGNGIIKTIRPCGKPGIGSRIKITWSGAEVKGRDRISSWDGCLKINGNKIKSFKPVNFWNPDSQPELLSPHDISWKSITTGGASGLIIELEDSESGILQISTKQLSCDVKTAAISLEPLVYEAGGIMKKIEIYRLPYEPVCDFEFSFMLDELKDGDNPVFIKMVQQDGHMAWSSPVYLVKNK